MTVTARVHLPHPFRDGSAHRWHTPLRRAVVGHPGEGRGGAHRCPACCSIGGAGRTWTSTDPGGGAPAQQHHATGPPPSVREPSPTGCPSRMELHEVELPEAYANAGWARRLAMEAAVELVGAGRPDPDHRRRHPGGEPTGSPSNMPRDRGRRGRCGGLRHGRSGTELMQLPPDHPGARLAGVGIPAAGAPRWSRASIRTPTTRGPATTRTAALLAAITASAPTAASAACRPARSARTAPCSRRCAASTAASATAWTSRSSPRPAQMDGRACGGLSDAIRLRGRARPRLRRDAGGGRRRRSVARYGGAALRALWTAGGAAALQ